MCISIPLLCVQSQADTVQHFCPSFVYILCFHNSFTHLYSIPFDHILSFSGFSLAILLYAIIFNVRKNPELRDFSFVKYTESGGFIGRFKVLPIKCSIFLNTLVCQCRTSYSIFSDDHGTTKHFNALTRPLRFQAHTVLFALDKNSSYPEEYNGA